jgi:hypothetical protein
MTCFNTRLYSHFKDWTKPDWKLKNKEKQYEALSSVVRNKNDMWHVLTAVCVCLLGYNNGNNNESPNISRKYKL